MSASYTADLPTIVELKPRGQFLPAMVTCSALDRRRRQLPTATLVLHSNTGARRARYVRADGRVTEVWFDNTSYTLLDEIAPEHLPLARERYRISAEQITITDRVTLQSYTVNGVAVYLCPACADKTPGKAKWSGELINGYCDGCGIGPSHPHFPATTERHQAAPTCPTCGSDGSPCVDCNPILATGCAPSAPCAGSRVEVAFGPDQGQTGTVHRALDHTGYIAVHLDRPGPWAEHLYLPEEIRPSLVPPPQERPWANDAAYSALG